MELVVNGEKRAFSSPKMDLLAFLKEVGVDPEQSGIAVAVNMSVLPRSTWETESVADGDEVEIIVARQGG